MEKGLLIMTVTRQPRMDPPAWLRQYARLIVEHNIVPIRTGAQHAKALRNIERLMKLQATDRATTTAIELFSRLIEDYESQQHPAPAVSPDKMLAHLIDARETSQSRVAKATGIPRSTISAVLAGRRSLSTDAIAKLSRHFQVSTDAFIA
jgi:HTH-type transcriptional regulator/antitoxin HigA